MARTSLGNPDAAVELLYNRHQQAFLSALRAKTPSGRHAFHRLSLFAGRRGGKTKVGALAVSEKVRVPKTTGWVCAPTYPDLHDFVIPEVFRFIPTAWIGNWSEQHYELELRNYAKVQFRSLEDPDKARGPGLDWAWIDETRKVAKLAWDTMLPAVTDKKGQAWFTTSPNGFDWCYDAFWQPAVQKVPGYWSVKYKTADNPIYQTKEGAEELADARRAMDPLFYQQEFEADFVTFTGAIYGATINNRLLRTDDEIRKAFPNWPSIDPDLDAYIAIDPGSDHPFAASLAVMTPIGLVFIGEVLERGKPIGEYVNLMQRMLGKFNPGRPFTPQTWAIDKSQKQFAIELAQAPHRIYATPAPNDVENGIRRVQSWIAMGQCWFLLPAHDPERGVPQTVEQMRGYRWADNTTPDGQARKERVMKLRDDLPDAVRYLLMTGPQLIDIDRSPSQGKRDLSGMDTLTRYEMELMREREGRYKLEEDTFSISESDLPGLIAGGDADTYATGDFWL
jgi:hypothetical protein